MPTPRLAQLAREGTLFQDAHCAAPTCSPSRAALLTGEPPHVCGMMGLAHRGFALKDPSHHLCHTLNRAGYETVLAGVQHVAREAEIGSLGYRRRLSQEYGVASEQGAARYLMNPSASPFFLDVGFFETHRADAESGIFTNGARIEDVSVESLPPPLPQNRIAQADFNDFRTSASELDRKIGIILDALDSQRLRDQTLVIFTTDHGPPFPGCKCNLSGHGTGVSLLIRGLGFLNGLSVPSMVSHLDIFPTLCELADIEPPSWLQGRSLLPLVDGRLDRLHDHLFAEVTYHATYEPMRSVRDSRFTYIRRFHQRTRPTLANIDNGLTKSFLYQNDECPRPPEGEELFDRWKDPAEQTNCIDQLAYSEVAQSLRQRLQKWMKDTHDLLLDGDVAPPPGAVVTDHLAYSPTKKRG